MAQPRGTTKTQRNRRVACAADGSDGCGFAVYVSRKQLVRAGAWTCPACGLAPMWPVDPDDATLVLTAEQLAEHPAIVEYEAAWSSAAHGQAGPGRALKNAGKTYSADAAAMARVERERRERAKARQLGALNRGTTSPDDVPADDGIPF